MCHIKLLLLIPPPLLGLGEDICHHRLAWHATYGWLVSGGMGGTFNVVAEEPSQISFVALAELLDLVFLFLVNLPNLLQSFTI